MPRRLGLLTQATSAKKGGTVCPLLEWWKEPFGAGTEAAMPTRHSYTASHK